MMSWSATTRLASCMVLLPVLRSGTLLSSRRIHPPSSSSARGMTPELKTVELPTYYRTHEHAKGREAECTGGIVHRFWA
jgi:hypothetical protein